MKHRVGILILVVSSVGSTSLGSASSPAQQPLPQAQDGASRPTAYEPAPNFIGGTITRVGANLVTLRTPDGDLVVDLRGARSVWRETEVQASELAVGDQLDVNGVRSSASFLASSAWANIGRFDGIIRSVTANRLDLVGLPPSTRLFHVEFSPYLHVVRDGDVPATTADLRPGMIVGGVTYRPKDTTPRATKIWF
jgi:hypothetical protein